jgi:hypothetical protein
VHSRSINNNNYYYTFKNTFTKFVAFSHLQCLWFFLVPYLNIKVSCYNLQHGVKLWWMTKDISCKKNILSKIKSIEKRKCVLFHFRVSAWTVWLFILCSLIVIDIYDLHRFQMQKTLFQIHNKNCLGSFQVLWNKNCNIRS